MVNQQVGDCVQSMTTMTDCERLCPSAKSTLLGRILLRRGKQRDEPLDPDMERVVRGRCPREDIPVVDEPAADGACEALGRLRQLGEDGRRVRRSAAERASNKTPGTHPRC